MENKKQKLTELINMIEDEKILDYLISFTRDFIKRYSSNEKAIESA